MNVLIISLIAIFFTSCRLDTENNLVAENLFASEVSDFKKEDIGNKKDILEKNEEIDEIEEHLEDYDDIEKGSLDDDDDESMDMEEDEDDFDDDDHESESEKDMAEEYQKRNKLAKKPMMEQNKLKGHRNVKVASTGKVLPQRAHSAKIAAGKNIKSHN